MSSSHGPSRPEWKPGWEDERSTSRSVLPFTAVAGGLIATAAALAGGVSAALLAIQPNKTPWLVVIIAMAIAAVIILGVLLGYFINQRSSASSLRIAILGLPQVGKTTLITACFQEIFSRRVNMRAVMSGSRSFELLNDNIARLASGVPPKPTSDQDVAAYRFEIAPSGLLASRYRVEIGDFPGEDTESYVQNYGPWLHGTPFFEWALTCDAFVFCVDAGPLSRYFRELTSEEQRQDNYEEFATRRYVNESSAVVRAAWQHIVDSFGPRRMSYLRKSPVLLTFTKLDLMYRSVAMESVPHDMRVTPLQVDAAQKWLQYQFADLISYLKEETTHFSTVATSSYATSGPGKLGISKFLHAVLPRQAFIRS